MILVKYNDTATREQKKRHYRRISWFHFQKEKYPKGAETAGEHTMPFG